MLMAFGLFFWLFNCPLKKYDVFWFSILAFVSPNLSFKPLEAARTSHPECSEIENMQLYYFIHYVCINQSLHHENKCLSVFVFFFVWSLFFSFMISFFLEFILFKSTGCCLIFPHFVLFLGIFHGCISKICIDFLKSLECKF